MHFRKLKQEQFRDVRVEEGKKGDEDEGEDSNGKEGKIIRLYDFFFYCMKYVFSCLSQTLAFM